MPPWNSAKAKVQLRLSVQRLRTLQQKKEAQAKASRRDIALLIERGKIETARVKVENIINEDIHVELLELLELYCELLLARFGLLEQNTREPDPGVSEGVNSIIHAAPRTELKELHILRDILMHKYGREFSVAVMENRDNCVSDRVVRKLGTAMPSAELVDAYLEEIAKAYGIDWRPVLSANQKAVGEGLETSEVKVKETAVPDDKALEPAAPDGTKGGTKTQSGEEVTPPKLPDVPPTEDNSPEESEKKLVKSKPGGGTAFTTVTKSTATSPRSVTPEDDFESLARRFAALKKR